MGSGAYNLKKNQFCRLNGFSVCQRFFGLKLYITIQCLQQFFYISWNI